MTPGSVLVIDADREWCARVCRFLEPHGIEVVTAASIDAARDTLAGPARPMAIVMDIASRQENGRAVSMLRGDVGFRDVPVGYVKKSAALDALLLMLQSSSAVSRHCAA